MVNVYHLFLLSFYTIFHFVLILTCTLRQVQHNTETQHNQIYNLALSKIHDYSISPDQHPSPNYTLSITLVLSHGGKQPFILFFFFEIEAPIGIDLIMFRISSSVTFSAENQKKKKLRCIFE